MSRAEPPTRAPTGRVELLIRGSQGPDGGGDFDIVSPDSGQAFLRMRPMRVRAVTLEENPIDEADGRVWVVRVNLGDTERYVKLNERERYLFVHMDGMHTIQDLALAVVMRFHSFDLDEVSRFLKRAHKLGIVDIRKPGMLRHRDVRDPTVLGRAYRRLLSLERRWTGVDGFFRGLNQVVGWMLSGRAVAASAPAVVVGLLAWALLRAGGALQGAPLGMPASIVVVLAGLVLFALPHELAHGIACRRWGRKVKSVGISFLDGLVPSVYVDVSDMLMSTPGGRVAVHLAGPWVNLLAAGILGMAAWLVPTPVLRQVLVLLADANLLLAAYTLWPFHGLEEDGYHALVDLTRVSAIRERSSALVRSWFSPKRRPEMSVRSLRVVRIYLFGRIATWAVGGLALGWAARTVVLGM